MTTASRERHTRAAQIGFDLQIHGATAFFTWPLPWRSDA